MARNTVDVVIKSKDEAKPDLTDLRARLAELGRTAETAKADLNDKDAIAKLATLQLRLDALGRRVENPKLNVLGAQRAEAELLRLDAQMSHIGDKAPAAAEANGQAAGHKFMSGFASFVQPSKMQLITSGVTAALAALPALGGIAGMLAGTAFAAKFLIGSSKAKGPLYKQFEGMLHSIEGSLRSAMGPMLAPLREAFKSLGAFFKEMGPVFHSLFAALAPTVMPLVHALEGLVGGVMPGFIAMIKAAGPALAVFGQLLVGLGNDLGSMFQAFAGAMGPSSQVLKMLAGLVNGLLPLIANLAGVFAKMLGPVLLQFGAAINALMPGLMLLGKVAAGLAQAIFADLAGALGAVAQMLKAAAPGFTLLAHVMSQFFNAMENIGVFGTLEDALEALAKPLGRLIALLISAVAPIAGQLMTAVAQLSGVIGGLLVKAVITLMPGISLLVKILVQFLASVLRPLIPAVLQLALALVKILAALMPLLPPLLQLTALLLRLIVACVMPLIPLIVDLAKVLSVLVTWVADAVSWIVRIITHALDWVSSFARVREAVAEVFDWIRSHWPLLLAILGGPIGAAVALIVTHWHQILTGTENAVHAVVGWFQRLPGMILHAVGNLGHLLWSAGADVMRGLIGGVESMTGSLIHSAEHIGGSILSSIKGALGIGSPSRITYQHGRWLAEGLINGMASMHGRVAQAAGAMAGAAAARPGGAGAAAGPAGGGVLRLEVTGGGGSRMEDLFVEMIREFVRIHGGGNVQAALGR